MNPRLVVITGPRGGTTLALGQSVAIGRGPDCQLRIKQPTVSRLHCLIERCGDGFRVTDHSSYGTFVNRAPVRERILEHGDQVEVGDSILLFILHDDVAAPRPPSVYLDDGDLITRTDLRLRDGETPYLSPGALAAEPRPPSRVARDLYTLLKLSTAVSSIGDLEGLQAALLTHLLEAVPAERAALVLLGGGLDDFDACYSSGRSGEPVEGFRVSRTVAQQVVRERVSILSNDVSDNEAYAGSESLMASRTGSLLCVPLTDGESVPGFFYLTSVDAQTPFDREHLELAMAVAGIASLAIKNIRHFEWLRDERRRLHEELSLSFTMIGDSPRMRDVFKMIAKVAPSDASVLVRGESGTGKELVTQAIHANSPRADKPFVAVNCAAITETLLESELFGHERGAFTGAITQKKGKLEVADGGTLFLDEIGELSPSSQSKLLRVLQERTFERVGGTRPIKINIRVIAATNRDLLADVARGAFREDLYYRLNVVEIEVPPLRERREDILLLARFFAARYGDECKRRVEGFTPEACACLMSYGWPGNVRELENAIERAIVLGSSKVISVEDLPEAVRNSRIFNAGKMNLYEILRDTKKQLILNAFDRVGGNHAEAARLLGVHANNLHRLIRTLDLEIK